MKRRFGSQGSAMVEFTLVVPVLVSLFLGVIAFGYNFHVYSRLEEMVRAGARYASMQEYNVSSGDDPAFTDCASCTYNITGLLSAKKGSTSTFLDRVRNVTVFGKANPSNTDLPVVEGITTDNVQVELGVVNNQIDSVTVRMTNVRLNMLGGTITLTDKPVARFIYPFPTKYKMDVSPGGGS